jgi:hypothetical protein
VSGRLERAAAFFLAPAGTRAPACAGAIPPAARVAVLGAPHDVAPLAAAVALDSAPGGLVALWRGDRTPTAGLATRAAVRLATRLTVRELPTIARGRLAWLVLPDGPGAAQAAVRRASALVAGPLVTALAGARPPELEPLIAEHDLAVVAADPATPLARAALAALAARGVQAAAIPPLRRGPARTLALAGIAAPRLGSVRGEPAGEGR